MDHRGQWYYPFACLVEYERDPLLCLFDRDRMLERDNPRTLSLEAAIPKLPAWSISLDSSICSIVSRSMLELETLTEKSNSVISFLRRWGKVLQITMFSDVVLSCFIGACPSVFPLFPLLYLLESDKRYRCWRKNFGYFFFFYRMRIILPSISRTPSTWRTCSTRPVKSLWGPTGNNRSGNGNSSCEILRGLVISLDMHVSLSWSNEEPEN